MSILHSNAYLVHLKTAEAWLFSVPKTELTKPWPLSAKVLAQATGAGQDSVQNGHGGEEQKLPKIELMAQTRRWPASPYMVWVGHLGMELVAELLGFPSHCCYREMVKSSSSAL